MTTEPSRTAHVSWTRRLFVKESVIGWLTLVVGPSVYALKARSALKTNEHGSVPMDIGAIADLQEGTAREFRFRSDRVIVARIGRDEWTAVSSVCTHLGCSIRLARRGSQADRVFACNCHESTFAADGTNLTGPAPYPLKRYRIELKEGRVLLAEPHDERGDSNVESASGKP